MERQELAERLATEVGAYLALAFSARKDIRLKRDGTVVTDADIEADRRIVASLASAFPDDAIVAEESGYRNGTSGVTWYIDPLDGTTNFASGIPIFATSLAYADDAGTLGAVVAMPTLRALVTAFRGKGVRWNGEPIAVIPFSSLEDSLSLLSYGDRHDSRVTAFLAKHPRVRILGSAVVSFCLVAAGSAPAYIAFRQHVWDYASGLLFVAEAGGAVATSTGEPFRLSSDGGEASDLIASTPEGIETLASSIRSL